MSKWNPSTSNHGNRYLICKDVIFYSKKDEEMFFYWIEKINCISSIAATRNILYLDLIDTDLTRDDVEDLIALFVRYKIEIHQLKLYKTLENSDAFDGWEEETFDILK